MIDSLVQKQVKKHTLTSVLFNLLCVKLIETSIGVVINMKKLFILLLLFIFSCCLPCLAWTTKQEAIVKNTNKTAIINQLEKFVIDQGYSFKYANRDTGRFEIFIRQTKSAGSFNQVGDNVIYNEGETTDWYFSLEIISSGEDIILKGSSHGGIAPGRYFGKLVDSLNKSGFNVIAGKDAKEITSQPAVNTPKSSFESSLEDVEMKTFNKLNNKFSIEERLSLLELHYFNNQLLNLSNEARLQAIQSKMGSVQKNYN